MADPSQYANVPPDQANAYGPAVPAEFGPDHPASAPRVQTDADVFAAGNRRADVFNDVRAIEKGMGRRVSPRFMVDDQ